jgi:hypothetical protein
MTTPREQTEVTKLIEVAAEAELWHTPDHRSYATFTQHGHTETWAVQSPMFETWLASRFFVAMKHAPTEAQLRCASLVIHGMALFGGKTRRPVVRVGGSADEIWLDMVDDDWRVIHITSDGWCIRPSSELPPDFRFRRPRGSLPLPVPDRKGDITLLRSMLNATNDDDWMLLLSWLIAAIRPAGPFPVLIVQGEQGSAKSTTCRLLRSVIDPNMSPLRGPPRNDRDLMIAAINSWVVSMENLSSVPHYMSDALCRLATGGGFSTRELYTDAGEFILDACRPVLMNGIDDFVVRPDLLDRSICVMLTSIDDRRRRLDSEINAEFEARHASILGGLLNLTVDALRRQRLEPSPDIALPRMADFARWLYHAEPSLAWPAGRFLRLYAENRAVASNISLSSLPVVEPLVRLLKPHAPREIILTAEELLGRLNLIATSYERRSNIWPSRAVDLVNQLRRVVGPLRNIGVRIEFLRRTGRRVIGASLCDPPLSGLLSPAPNDSAAPILPPTPAPAAVPKASATEGTPPDSPPPPPRAPGATPAVSAP